MSTVLRDAYVDAIAKWSDVQQHLPTFVREATFRHAQTVVELGSRDGTSTWAWLYALERTGGKLWTVDLSGRPPCGDWPFWEHIQGDDLSAAVLDALPGTIEILFIDTLHDYTHCSAELAAYMPRMQPGGVVFLHDADLADPWAHDRACPEQEPYPIRRAMRDYCTPRGLHWAVMPGSYGLGRIDAP